MPSDEPSTSILPIVTSQRDRFRQRNIELEGELRHARTASTKLQNDVRAAVCLHFDLFLTLYLRQLDGMRSDNIKLYEKIKFLQSYGGKSRTTSNDDTYLDRYSNDYEESLSPFQQFIARARSRANL